MLRTLFSLTLLVLVPVRGVTEDVEFHTPSGESPYLRVEVHWGRIEIGTHPASYARIGSRGESSGENLRSLNEPRLQIETGPGRISVSQPEPERGSFRSAIVEVLVPDRCHLELVMLRGGDIRVSDVDGEISITNLNGSVELADVAGAALVNASNGSIQASFRRVDEELDLQFTTLNGSVEVCLPGGFQAQLALYTEGDPILSDFDVRPPAGRPGGAPEIESRGRDAVMGRIGESTRWLVASTLNGEIRVEQCDR